MNKACFLAFALLGMNCVTLPVSAATVDVFFVGGQSNAKPEFAHGIEEVLRASGRYPQLRVVYINHSGRMIACWWDVSANALAPYYLTDFLNPAYPAPVITPLDRDASGKPKSINTKGALKTALDEIAAAGDTGRVSGFFWFQGETDAPVRLPVQTLEFYRAHYGAALTAMLARIAGDLNHGEPVPFALARIATGKGDRSDQICNYALISHVQQEVADASPVGVALDTETYTRPLPNNVHVTIDPKDPMNLTQLGRDLATAFLKKMGHPSGTSQ